MIQALVEVPAEQPGVLGGVLHPGLVLVLLEANQKEKPRRATAGCAHQCLRCTKAGPHRQYGAPRVLIYI
jgi:hypothetical protein